jgi:hypothetical protein
LSRYGFGRRKQWHISRYNPSIRLQIEENYENVIKIDSDLAKI